MDRRRFLQAIPAAAICLTPVRAFAALPEDDSRKLDDFVREISGYDIVHFGEVHKNPKTTQTSTLEDFSELMLHRLKDPSLVQRPFAASVARTCSGASGRTMTFCHCVSDRSRAIPESGLSYTFGPARKPRGMRSPMTFHSSRKASRARTWYGWVSCLPNPSQSVHAARVMASGTAKSIAKATFDAAFCQ